jgi:hypothetical protein
MHSAPVSNNVRFAPKATVSRQNAIRRYVPIAATNQPPLDHLIGTGQQRAQAISEDLGIKLDKVTLNMLGRAKKVMIEKENTTIVSAGEDRHVFEHGLAAHFVHSWFGLPVEMVELWRATALLANCNRPAPTHGKVHPGLTSGPGTPDPRMGVWGSAKP